MKGVPKQLFPGTPQLVELSGEPARRTASAFAQETEELCTDSSMTGWGATLNTVHMVHGVWDQTTSDSRSINWLELKTVQLAILYFLDPSKIGQ